ncbi:MULTISPECIES: helix-turn-helix domain-containing protein [Amycolatopsis]|uniref:Helix-turn-helix protein n=2 Tax=Amycolatopsis TaxID=1813 RepID=A0A3N2H626_9PSEU|nr:MULTISPECIES: helix-turn-helix domain-containing protein [Amycolatopsis]MCF6423729.1 helix-turn-helix domain-containing protein [Amycolatopsis tucumanensis]ROS44368.1 helix-turn-helix protein [Amycolatopsis thermoflava]
MTESRRSASPATCAELARRIRNGRKDLGLTAEQLAHRADVTVRYVQAMEAQDIKNPGLQNLLQLAAALQLNSGDFLRDLPPAELG